MDTSSLWTIFCCGSCCWLFIALFRKDKHKRPKKRYYATYSSEGEPTRDEYGHTDEDYAIMDDYLNGKW